MGATAEDHQTVYRFCAVSRKGYDLHPLKFPSSKLVLIVEAMRDISQPLFPFLSAISLVKAHVAPSQVDTRAGPYLLAALHSSLTTTTNIHSALSITGCA